MVQSSSLQRLNNTGKNALYVYHIQEDYEHTTIWIIFPHGFVLLFSQLNPVQSDRFYRLFTGDGSSQILPQNVFPPELTHPT